VIATIPADALDPADAALLAAADAVAARAYAPYSGFHVGAAARARDGRVFAGCNVENAGDIDTVAITASPCGGCRQWLAEFRVGRVLYRREDGTVASATPAELLPDTFRF
jgi:cytidine deaminase